MKKLIISTTGPKEHYQAYLTNMATVDSTKLRLMFLELQKQGLIEKYERLKKRNAFIQKNLQRILSLSMDGWPRTKEMKDYLKWLDIIYEAKIKGIYSVGTSNCDVIAMLNRYANELSKISKPNNNVR